MVHTAQEMIENCQERERESTGWRKAKAGENRHSMLDVHYNHGPVGR